VISGTRSLEEAVWHDPATNLFFLPAIKTAPLFSSEVLGSEPIKSLIDRLRTSFDLVIVDLPPLVPIVDARAAAHLVDCMILVIEWGRTKIEIVRHALDTAPNLHQLSLVLCSTKPTWIIFLSTMCNTRVCNQHKHYARCSYSGDN